MTLEERIRAAVQAVLVEEFSLNPPKPPIVSVMLYEDRSDLAAEEECAIPDGPPSSRLVSSAVADRIGAHEEVRVWNRGGLAGVLVVERGDGPAIVERLTGGMVQGRVKASDALDAAAGKLGDAGGMFRDEMLRIASENPTRSEVFREASRLTYEAATAARGAAAEVRKEIGP